ncbi:MAG TPA: hypothetical protein VFU30_11890 [Gaiellaceae bacterium]|nr:hypothetical protein [Gaiellaceae bacterium]
MATAKKKWGKTASGAPITGELVAELAEKAEAGYDVDKMLRRRRAEPDRETISSVSRRAPRT